ncbi:putative peroxisomal-coenzyme A synthetase [Golovinomyces cichoracearum]|uniref:Putative peroxisomal-coenzyme A synthetase n=1 Tax=Golovinomyces cichoracearum TaxID=62708 RepID=A0A420HFM6_9PEZI|nr:putative peroxisomal-coenzyme A synthetase [Golovinomyces cichoracearum]
MLAGTVNPASTLFNAFSCSDHTTAIIVPGKKPVTISFKDIRSEILSFQIKLAHLGITPGDAVSLALPNSYEFVISFLASTSQRAISTPLNPAYTQEEFEFYISDLDSSLLLVPLAAYEKNIPAVRAARKQNAAIAECYWNGQEMILDVKEDGKLRGKGNQKLERTQPNDVALVLHTSGTTGRPKAVPLTHRNLIRSMNNIRDTYALSTQDRSMLVMPLFHVHGLLAGLLAPLYAGGSVIIPRKFSATKFWFDFTAHGANWYTAVPTIHQILLQNPLPNPKPTIRFIRSCSSPLSPTISQAIEEAYGAPVLEAYAMTEAAHQITSNPLPPAHRQPGSVGIAQGVSIMILNEDGDDVPIGKEGEICIKGENVTVGYLNNPVANNENFTKNGFFRTGDQGIIDEKGYLYISGRIKELINKAGEKISPVELDNVLLRHPKVSEVVSFAVPDPMYGQNVAIAVVAKSKLSISEKDIQEWMGERLAKFKMPKEIYFVEEIPKTATGKIQRRLVAEEILRQRKITAKL